MCMNKFTTISVIILYKLYNLFVIISDTFNLKTPKRWQKRISTCHPLFGSLLCFVKLFMSKLIIACSVCINQIACLAINGCLILEENVCLISQWIQKAITCTSSVCYRDFLYLITAVIALFCLQKEKVTSIFWPSFYQSKTCSTATIGHPPPLAPPPRKLIFLIF